MSDDQLEAAERAYEAWRVTLLTFPAPDGIYIAGYEAAEDESQERIEALGLALRQIMDEIGVPGDGHPAPAAHAYEIARTALAKQEEAEHETGP